MLHILMALFFGWLLGLAGIDSLIGLEGSVYYLAWAVFGALVFFIEKLKR